MALKYELHTSEILPEVKHLWCSATGWGDWFDHLQKWFEAAPSDVLRILLATDTETNQLVGQFCFMQTRVSVDGEKIRAVRPFGTIVTPAMSEAFAPEHPLDHPAGAMYNRAAERLQAMGDQLIYMVPDPRWLRLFKMFPGFQTGSFPLWSLPIPLDEPIKLDESYAAAPMENWDERVDRLWEKTTRLYGCVPIRDCAALRWKLADPSFTNIAVERDGELVGLVASRHKGDRQWLICDMLCADAGESMRHTLAAACNVAHENSVALGGKSAIHKVAVLTTPLMQPIVESLGFERDAYDFSLVVHILDSKIAPENVAPERWYLSGND